MFCFYYVYICPLFMFLYMNSSPIKDWLYYSRGQRLGIGFLLFLIVLTPVMAGIAKRKKTPTPSDIDAFIADITRLEEQLLQVESASATAKDAALTIEPPGQQQKDQQLVLSPFPFDPNNTTAEDWHAMGMPQHISRSIHNFLAAGGNFRYREDLQRIYLLEDWMYEALKEFIELPSRPIRRELADNRSSLPAASDLPLLGDENQNIISETAPINNTRLITKSLMVDINLADTNELQKIRGIGPAFSRRIVGYRELLGGYRCTDQLLEVYGIDSTRYDAIREFITVDELDINKINLNTAEFGDLIRHPYIDRQTANAILSIRNQHGPYASADELNKSYLIDETTIKRIMPYVCVEED